MAKKYKSTYVASRDGVVTLEEANRPAKSIPVGKVVARVWRNELPLGTEWRIDCVYVYSRWSWTSSMPIDSIGDATKALKKARSWAKREEMRGRWLAILLLRW